MLTIHLEDHGQDFLEWDIKDSIVVASRPFQGWLWVGTQIHNIGIIKPGDILEITAKGERTTLNYPVVRVEEKVGV